MWSSVWYTHIVTSYDSCNVYGVSIVWPGAWIISGGMNSGVMKYVGEAMRDYWLTAASTVPAVALGIANWGSVKNRDDLQDDFVRVLIISQHFVYF